MTFFAGSVLCGDPTEVHAPTSRRFSGKVVMRGSGFEQELKLNAGFPETGRSFLGVFGHRWPSG
jgi:hypothetical protein